MADARFTPSLFDKLTGGRGVAPVAAEDGGTQSRGNAEGSPFRFYTVGRLDRYGTDGVKNVLRRDLGWLLNVTNLASTVDLDDVPEVQRSVLNYGLSDLAGKSQSRRALEQRARDMRAAIRTFEPRLARERLDISIAHEVEKSNAVTFVVQSDILSAVQPLPVAYKTDVEVDTGATRVRE